MKNYAGQRGVTLIELAIVVIIIGLLMGGVLAGQSLIRSSEVSAITQEVERYANAMATFRDRFHAMPGDMPTATAMWGAAHGTPGTCITTASTGPETCDGNGDEQIGDAANPHEMFRAWQQLGNAGFLNERYTGVAGAGGVRHHVVGVNCPEAELAHTGFGIMHSSNATADWYLIKNIHVLAYGIEDAALEPRGPKLTPQEALALDQKGDDGKPGTGVIRTHKPTLYACATTNSELTAEYDSAAGTGCGLIFLMGF